MRSIEGDAMVLGPSEVGIGSVIGNNSVIGYPVRRKILQLPKASFLEYDTVSVGTKIGPHCIVRSNSTIYEGTSLGEATELGHGVLVRENCEIGAGTRIGTCAVIDGSVIIGSRCSIQTGVYLPPGTVVGSSVFMGSYVTVTNDRYPPSPKTSGVVVESGAVVGEPRRPDRRDPRWRRSCCRRRGSGDEVIVPSFTFVATASSVLLVGARPVFVDIDPDTYNMDPAQFRRAITPRTKAVIPIDLYGLPAAMNEINEIARQRGITVIEDACQAQGSSYKGRMAGTLGDMGCFSFYLGR